MLNFSAMTLELGVLVVPRTRRTVPSGNDCRRSFIARHLALPALDVGTLSTKAPATIAFGSTPSL